MSKKPMRIPSLIGLAALVAVITATASCGDVVRSNDSSVMLVVNSLTADGSNVLLSDVLVGGTVFNDPGLATLGVIMKNVAIGPTTNNNVTISRYHVHYRRADGRNTPGVDVPFGFDGAATVTIPAGGNGSVSFELVRHVAKKESPLVQLLNEIRVINVIAEVTFYGRDQAGNDVSVVGAMQIDFANFGD
jgi:hypothetical protein